VVVPAEADNLQLLRLAGAFVGVRAGAGYDTAEDLRLAVDELCATILEVVAGPGCDLHVAFSWDDAAIDVTVTLTPSNGAAPPVDAADLDDLRQRRRTEDGDGGLSPARISELIMEALVDEHRLGLEDGVLVGWFRKRVAEPS
jgi:hypothetical protein